MSQAMSSKKLERELRNAVCGLSSGTYYLTLGHYWNALDEVLTKFGLRVGIELRSSRLDSTTTGTYQLVDDASDAALEDVALLVQWYRMPSGKYEITNYLT